MGMSGHLVSEAEEARGVLDVHVRGLDGCCACGAPGICAAYEQASALLAAHRVLPRRHPDAARRDLMRRKGRAPR